MLAFHERLLNGSRHEAAEINLKQLIVIPSYLLLRFLMNQKPCAKAEVMRIDALEHSLRFLIRKGVRDVPCDLPQIDIDYYPVALPHGLLVIWLAGRDPQELKNVVDIKVLRKVCHQSVLNLCKLEYVAEFDEIELVLLGELKLLPLPSIKILKYLL